MLSDIRIITGWLPIESRRENPFCAQVYPSLEFVQEKPIVCG
jgi:hypothetical protein